MDRLDVDPKERAEVLFLIGSHLELSAPIMYWAPWVKLMMLSSPKITESPRLSMA